MLFPDSIEVSLLDNSIRNNTLATSKISAEENFVISRQLWPSESTKILQPRLPRKCGKVPDTMRARIAGGVVAPKGFNIIFLFNDFSLNDRYHLVQVPGRGWHA